MGAEKSFWLRDNLIFLGDLSELVEREVEGFEYITKPARTNNEFEYTYGMIMIKSDKVVNELVCEVKGPVDGSHTFMMEIQGGWVKGPLEAWINTMPLAQKEKAENRYQNLIEWVYTQI